MTRSRRIALGLLVALTGGRLVQAALGPLYGGTVRLEVADLPDSPAPTPHWSAAQRWPLALVHETLVTLDAEGRPRPRLATGWIVAAESREWTLTLADGLVFHDGRPLTSTDAVRSLRRFVRSASPAAERLAASLDGGAAYRSGTSDALPGLAAPEPGRVVLRALTPDPQLLVPLAAPAAAVTSPEGAGAGPFAPTLWTVRGATLLAFTGHAQGRPLLDEVQLVVAGTASADVRSTAPAGWTSTAAAAATLLLVLDPTRPPFDAPAARRAVRAAIDPARLVQHFLRRGEASRSLLPPALALGPAPAAALEAPALARVDGAITLAVSTDVPPLVSQRVVAHLSALGLAVKALPTTPDDASTGPYAARLVLASPEVADAGLALRALAGLVGRAGDEARQLLAAADTLTGSPRVAQLARAENALLATHVLIPLAAVPVEVHARPGLFGLRVDATGTLRLEDAWREP